MTETELIILNRAKVIHANNEGFSVSSRLAHFHGLIMVAIDLGSLTPEVTKLRDELLAQLTEEHLSTSSGTRPLEFSKKDVPNITLEDLE